MNTPGHDVLALSPARPRWTKAFDRLLGSDPGLIRLRSALMVALTVGAIIAAEWVFVHFTHALQSQSLGANTSATATAEMATANHVFLVIAVVFGAIVGLTSASAVTDPTAEGQLKTMLLLPVPMIGALALGISLGGYRVVSLVGIAVVLSIGTYLRRFGPRGMVVGVMLYMGDLLGFFLHKALTVSDLGWLSAEIGVGLVVAMVVRFALFYPRPARSLARTQRSFGARADKVATVALALFDDPAHTERQIHRIDRQLIRLNETALMIDAQLGNSSAVAEGSSGQRLHQRLFDVELALTNMVHSAQALGRDQLPTQQKESVCGALVGIVEHDAQAARDHVAALMVNLPTKRSPEGGNDATAAILHRFAESVIDLAVAMTDWENLGTPNDGKKSSFAPSVELFGGFLPGSALVSTTASQESGHHLFDQIILAPYTRTAIQMGVAAGAAIAFGVMISSDRFYWALIAVVVTFTGTHTSGEQALKAIFRVLGTVVGIGVGSGLVTLVGHHTDWSLGVILVSLFLGRYLLRINFAFMVVGVTVAVSQLYVQLGEFSNSLLLLRLEETALGAAIAVVVVTLVLPLRTKKVVRTALRMHVEALATLVDHATSRIVGDAQSEGASLSGDARHLDASFQALDVTAEPLRRNLTGSVDEAMSTTMRFASASRHYGHNLVLDVEDVGRLDTPTRIDLEAAAKTLLNSLAIMAEALNGPRNATYTRSASMFDRAERRLEKSSGTPYAAGLAFRDLMLIDQTMASVAEAMGLHVTDSDTTQNTIE